MSSNRNSNFTINTESTVDIGQAYPGELLRPSQSSHVFAKIHQEEANNVRAEEGSIAPHTIPEWSEYKATY